MNEKVVTSKFSEMMKRWTNDLKQGRTFMFIIGLSCGDPGDFSDTMYLESFLKDNPHLKDHIIDKNYHYIMLSDLDAAEKISEFLSMPYTVVCEL